jgi:hypothetical protein
VKAFIRSGFITRLCHPPGLSFVTAQRIMSLLCLKV